MGKKWVVPITVTRLFVVDADTRLEAISTGKVLAKEMKGHVEEHDVEELTASDKSTDNSLGTVNTPA